MTSIVLNRTWQIGKQFARGGFGRIHEAEADDGSAAVVKLIPKARGASRELLFEELSGLPNIVPILDSGEWKDYHVLVMPRAQMSLREYIDHVGTLGADDSVGVLVDVARALASLQTGVVHRDLKPQNVLFLNGHWCLADFGIARYAEVTTASDTHKFAMTPAYAAPEQWRHERATPATDVYAFGIMAFEILECRLPFLGPDFREQHLKEPAPALATGPAPLVSLVSECLFKAPAARPTAANVLERLGRLSNVPSPGGAKLQEVQRSVVHKQAEAARMSANESIKATRGELLQAARKSLEVVTTIVRERVLAAAPATEVSVSQGRTVFRLGEGVLIIDAVEAAPADCLAAYNYEPAFDVVAYSAIAARKPGDKYGYEGRAHSLWFGDAHDEGVYRWYELAFMVLPGIPQRSTLDPFALPPTDENAAVALTPVTDVRQVAWQPVPFDQGDEEPFIERWLGWFAAAAEGGLSHPSHMPENSGGRYRSSVVRSR